MGVLDYARADLEALMRDDEEIAEQLDARRFAAEEAARAVRRGHHRGRGGLTRCRNG